MTHRRVKRGRRNRRFTKRRSHRGMKWETSIEAARNTLKKTKSVDSAKRAFMKQSVKNAKKLFGAVGI